MDKRYEKQKNCRMDSIEKERRKGSSHRNRKDSIIRVVSYGTLAGAAAASVLAVTLIFGDLPSASEAKEGKTTSYGEEYLILDELDAGRTEDGTTSGSGNVPATEAGQLQASDQSLEAEWTEGNNEGAGNVNRTDASVPEAETDGESGQKQGNYQSVAGTPVGSEHVSEEDWNLILVNRWNPIPEDYSMDLTELMNGQSVDSRIYPELQQMFDDARAAGMLPQISSSYRTTEMQQELMDEKIAEYQAEGNSYEDARALAEKWVAVPGTSEHQIGIAVDITTADWQQQDASVIWQWLEQNSYKYGFILRYTAEKTDITGVIAEPWHFRYVGKEAAKEIYEQGVCLEEYLGAIGK